MTTCHTCHAEPKQKTPYCFKCKVVYDTWNELAIHISTSKIRHPRSSKTWAANFLMKVNERPDIKKIAVNPDYEPTELGIENRRKATVQLSGENEYVSTFCPNCKRTGRELLPVEFIHSDTAWKIGDKLAVNCQGCSRKRE